MSNFGASNRISSLVSRVARLRMDGVEGARWCVLIFTTHGVPHIANYLEGGDIF